MFIFSSEFPFSFGVRVILVKQPLVGVSDIAVSSRFIYIRLRQGLRDDKRQQYAF